MRTGVGSVGGSREPRARAGDVLFLRSRAWNCSEEPRRRASWSEARQIGVPCGYLRPARPSRFIMGFYELFFVGAALASVLQR